MDEATSEVDEVMDTGAEVGAHSEAMVTVDVDEVAETVVPVEVVAQMRRKAGPFRHAMAR